MFTDRADAGRRLAAAVVDDAPTDLVVLGLPRGGVPVAAHVAATSGAPLDVLVVRKLGVPGHPEVGFGAIGEGGVRVLDQQRIDELGISTQEVDAVVARELAELERRVARYRRGRPPVGLRHRPVLIVDDGLATGVSARAAIAVCRAAEPSSITFAVPVASVEGLATLDGLVDETVCLVCPEPFGAVGRFYDDFGQTTDDEVTASLTAAAHH